ncbi:hypothetical protein JCM10207_007921 [Rhodosporidiobolus poonsookiae]
MSADLSTGKTPVTRSSAGHTKGGISLHMAPGFAPISGTQMSPEEYFKRKVVLITECAFSEAFLPRWEVKQSQAGFHATYATY